VVHFFTGFVKHRDPYITVKVTMKIVLHPMDERYSGEKHPVKYNYMEETTMTDALFVCKHPCNNCLNGGENTMTSINIEHLEQHAEMIEQEVGLLRRIATATRKKAAALTSLVAAQQHLAAITTPQPETPETPEVDLTSTDVLPEAKHLLREQLQHAEPQTAYTFHYVDDYYGESQTTTIHSLSGLVPQEGDDSGVLEEKEYLLERLGIYVVSMRKHTVEQEELQRLTRMVAALDDPEMFTRIINDDIDAFEDCRPASIKAVFPQPQTGVVETVDTDKWTTTIATMERLLPKLPKYTGEWLKTLLEQYKHLFTSLCYLEVHSLLSAFFVQVSNDAFRSLLSKRQGCGSPNP